jgi:antitoxin ParD1/3/4
MSKTTALQVKLDTRSRKLTARLVKSGRYSSAEDVARAAYRLLEEEERDYAECVEGIRRGLADVAAGRVRPAEEVFADLERKYPDVRRAPRAKRRA